MITSMYKSDNFNNDSVPQLHYYRFCRIFKIESAFQFWPCTNKLITLSKKSLQSAILAASA